VNTSGKSVWELLWDHDPNGLVVVDRQLKIQLANPAFCCMLRTNLMDLLQKDARTILDDADDLSSVWANADQILQKEHHYARYDLYVRKVMFAIRNQGIIACIIVDMTHEWKQKQELLRLKEQMLANVDLMVDKQMKTAQEIAGLLGETTAQAKVNMLKLAEMLKKEDL
jgi:hypothetical protein